MEISSRVSQIDASPTLAISAQAKELCQQGKNVISLGAGEPDFNTPLHIKEAAKEAMAAGFTNYTATVGTKELRTAVTDRFNKQKKIEYSSEQVIVSPGAKYALFLTLQVLVDEGDEVILPAPYWVSYPQQVKFAGGKMKAVETKEENDFKLTSQELKDSITPQTKVLILNTPSNPTGAIYSQEELAKIAEIAIKEDIMIIADEIYQQISYDKEAVSIASLGEEIKEQTVIIDGVSKAYAMTGWRIGFAVGPQEVIAAMACLQSHSTSSANSIAQKASVAALSGTHAPTEKMKKAFKQRRDLIVEQINQIPSFKAKKPAGAFYLFVNVKDALGQKINGEKITNDQKLANLLLQEAGVATIPGSFFGKDGYLRMSYATSESEIKTAINKIKDFLA
ncbi:aspartate/tyrosine/aromatic aminotransferase [Halobacteroides halobius DSM 5150]|uniref:Aminotransferase n=1 Tax=Halobacteroides halobius (strain ATCC 35273 / DSM 5150 / MD-1) TaxID=748449 RepID=L0K542_HALHC|nr:pyridoxal phosphate-dependent aminotransferase [Halobacteroides halobius]AGB40377.1 aspartate/tyrosine/aromatic aminotransferase [Halobacteroides halobius DSM 5150]